MKKIILALLLVLVTASFAAADTIVLRNGTSLRGTVLGFINGRFAVRLNAAATLPVNPGTNRNQTGAAAATRVVREGDVIFLRPRDIDRLEIDGRSIDDARYQTRTVDVSLGPNWIDSGIDVRRGERIRSEASGTIYVNRTRITPAGSSTTDPSSPLPRVAEGELIGVIGNDYDSPVIELGANRDFVAERDGRLFLTVNRGSYQDARGSYSVRISKELDLSAMARADENRNANDNSYDPFGFPGESGPASTRARTRSGGGDFPRNRDNRTLEKVIDVPANLQRGVDTGIELRTGDQVTITATGTIIAGRRAGEVPPDGGRSSGASGFLGTNLRPVPTAGVGALIGVLFLSNGQNSQPFLVGNQLTFTAPADGRLFLLVNDDNYSDNSGSFSVRIRYPN